MFRIIKVKGNSLLPNIAHGDYLLVRTFYKKPKIGDIVVVDHPNYGTIVKKVCELLGLDQCLITSTNPQGITSTQIGAISPKQIIGIKAFHVKQPQKKT